MFVHLFIRSKLFIRLRSMRVFLKNKHINQWTSHSKHYNHGAACVNIPYPVRSPAPQLPILAEWGPKWAAVHLPLLSKTQPSFSAFTHQGLPVCTLLSPWVVCWLQATLRCRWWDEEQRDSATVCEAWVSAGTRSWGPEGKYGMVSVGYRSPGGSGCMVVTRSLQTWKWTKHTEWAAGKQRIEIEKCEVKGRKKVS